MHIVLFICLSVCLSICLSVCLSICLSVCLSIYLSMYIHIIIDIICMYNINIISIWIPNIARSSRGQEYSRILDRSQVTNPYSGHWMKKYINVSIVSIDIFKQLVANYMRWQLRLPIHSFACFCFLSLLIRCYSGYILVSRNLTQKKSRTSSVAIACVKQVLAQWKIKWHERRSRYMLTYMS